MIVFPTPPVQSAGAYTRSITWQPKEKRFTTIYGYEALYGLFYFEIDKSTSILPNKKIKKVLSRDNNSKGSKVVVQFGSEDLEATITGVEGKHPTNSLIIRLAYNRVE